MTERTPASACPSCGKVLDAATGMEGGDVRPGAVTICLYCGHIMAFAEDMTFRELTDDEMHDIAGDRRVMLAQLIRTLYMKEEKK